MLAPRRRSASFAAALVVVATLLLGLPTVPTVAASTDDPTSTSEVTVAPANGTAVVGLDKQASPDTLAPGQETEFRVVVSCSSLEVPCANLVVEDVLPAEFDVTSLPASNSQRTVIWEPVTRQLQVTFIVPLGGGQFGLPAGSSQAIAIGMRLPSETAVIDGQVITNTATATADLAQPAQDTADVTAVIPVRYDAVATKSWSPDSGLAGSAAPSEIILGVRNTSTSSSPVNEVRVADTTAATFERFDLTGAGVVDSFPDGANRVVVETCQLPVGTACTDSDWVASLAQAGPALVLPGGVAAANVTGIRYRFTDSGGALLPYSPTPSAVRVPVVLRSTYRTSGAPLEPTTTELVTNCAAPSVRAVGGASTAGTDVCATYAIQPGDVRVTANKAFFADSNGDYRADGNVVAGQDSGVSMRITATNDSAFPVSVMRLREPSPSAVTDFAKVDVTRGRITFPAGATSAEVAVDCRSGADPAPQILARPASGDLVNLADLGCIAGVAAASVSVTFTGVSGGQTAVIAPGAAGILELHGTAPGAAMADVTDGGLTNCAEVTLSSEVDGTGSATSDACASVAVVAPNPAVGSGTKSTNGVTTMTPGQDLTFNLSFRNSGNVPVTNVVLVDPPDPSASANPFGVVRLTSLRAVTASPASDLEVYDPTVADYVPYVGTDTALLARATGIRVRVTGNLGVGDTFRVAYSVRLRDGVSPSATFRNCAAVGIDTPSQTFCGPTISAAPPSSGGSFNKSLVPSTVVRPKPGLADQIVDVRHRVTNTGTLNLKRLVVTDVDTDFFDAVDYSGQIRVNFPVGANRVQVDACTSVANCTNGIWVVGTRTASATPGLPSGVLPASVKGLRFTFTNSNNGYELLPSPNYPTSGGCPNATVCFRVKVRQTLASNPASPIPASLLNTSDAAGESQLQPSGTTFAIPPASATVTVTEGTPTLSLSKGPESRIGPGDVAPISLVTTNTGTDNVTNPVVVDPLPAGLTFDPTITGGSPAAPYLINYVLPAGVNPPSSVVFTPEVGSPVSPPVPGCTDVNRVCRLSWSFPNWSLPPGGRIELQFNVVLTPGVLAGEVLTNTAGASGTDPDLGCAGTSVVNNALYGQGRFCTDATTVTTLAGDDFIAEKWIAADPDLGLRNAAGQIVSLDDPSCPRYVNGDRIYTRYPCTARVRAGGTIDYLIRGVNSGTNPATEIVLVDGLPVQGDVGVLLSGQARGTQWSQRPTMLSGVTNIEDYPGVSTGYTNAGFPSSAFCTANLARPPADTCPSSAFNAPFGASVTGFRTTMSFPSNDLLAPGESFALVWSMRAPIDLTSSLGEPVAWNSFAYRPSFRLPGGQTTVLPATEPLKVGVGMPLGTFVANKTVEGLPPGVPLEPFQMAYICEVTTPDEVVTEVASGTFTLVDGGTYTGPLVPDAATCRVWETNSQGGQSNMAGEESAAVVGINANDPAPVAVINEFDTGALTVSKAVVWDDVQPVPIPGPYLFDVSCAFPGPSDLLPGFPQQLALNDGESATITDLPVGTTCDVTETETREAMEVTMAPSNAPTEEGTTVSVLIDEFDPTNPQALPGTKVEVTNTYTTGGVVVTKELDGAASQWAQGPYLVRVACTDPLGGLDPVIEELTLWPDDLTGTVSPIPAGYLCTVTEPNPGDAAGSTISPAGSFVIPSYDPEPPGPVEVTVTNDYPAGSISAAKVLNGSAAAPMAGARFTLRVQCERDLVNGDGTQVFIDETVVLTGGESTLIDDTVPLGSRCWATETDTVGATEVAVSATANAKVTIDAMDQDVTITATNTYEPGGSRAGADESGIRVTKVLAGDGVRWATGPFRFATTCTLAGYDLPAYPELVLDVDQLVGYVNPIPVGAVCTVTEVNDGSADGDVPRAVGTVTIPAVDQPAVDVVATNEFPLAVVEIAKELDGVGPSGSFVINLDCAVGSSRLNLSGGGAPFATTGDPSSRLEISAGASVQVVVPVGATCSVTEPDARGAVSTQIAVSGDQAPDAFTVSGPTRVVVTNRYEPGAAGLPATGLGGFGPAWLAVGLAGLGVLLVWSARRRVVPA